VRSLLAILSALEVLNQPVQTLVICLAWALICVKPITAFAAAKLLDVFQQPCPAYRHLVLPQYPQVVEGGEGGIDSVFIQGSWAVD
jgi:hypothetical protein